MRVCWGVKAIYGLQGGVLSTRTPFWAPHPCGHPPHTHCSSPGQGSQGQGWGQVSIPRSPSGSGSSSRFRVLPSRTWPCTTSMGSLSSCSRVWGSPSIARYCTFRGRASCSSFQKSEEGAWGPGRGRQPSHLGSKEHTWKGAFTWLQGSQRKPLFWAAGHRALTHGVPCTNPVPYRCPRKSPSLQPGTTQPYFRAPPHSPLRTTEPGLQSSRVTRWRCWRSRRSAGCTGSRLCPSKVMKMGLRVSSSSRHRPSLRGRDR